jgi:hypothetical protein
VSPKTNVAIGSGAILVALALVPAIWACGEGISGWNVLIFGLVAAGSSQLGSAAGRWSGQRVVGIAVTVIGVLVSLFAIGVITSGTCS